MTIQKDQPFDLEVPFGPGVDKVRLELDGSKHDEVDVEESPVTFPFPKGLSQGLYSARAISKNDGGESLPSPPLLIEVVDPAAPEPPGPIILIPGSLTPTDDYFERMAARPDCIAALALSSQEELDSCSPPQKATNYPSLEGVYVESPGYDPSKPTQKKRPIVYDPSENAARLEILPIVSTDTQQKYYRFSARFPNSHLSVLDLKLDENWGWRREVVEKYGKEQFTRHKARQLRYGNNGAYITERTFYSDAYWENQRNNFETNWVAQYVQTSNSSTRMLNNGNNDRTEVIPGEVLSWTENERLCPQIATFFIAPNVRMRRWTLMDYECPITEWTESPITDKQLSKWPNGHIVRISTWYADVNRDPIQTLDRLPMICEYPDIDCLADEFDTGQDKCQPIYDADGNLIMPGDRRLRLGYSQNFLAFVNPGPINQYLERPL